MDLQMKFKLHFWFLGFVSSFIFLFSVSSFAGKLFVDDSLTSDCMGAYSIVNRDCSGSDGTAYTKIQTAVTAMQPGDTLFIRGGIYNEMNIYVGTLNKGTESKWYTICSYPDEWAIIDGMHDLVNAHSQTYNGYIFRGTTANGVQGYIRFERLEITGGGLDTNNASYPSSIGGGIKMRGGPFEFRSLFIHNNYGDVNNNNGGLILENGTGGTTIEYCHLKANGDVKKDQSTSSANLIIFADYKYASIISSVLNPTTGYYQSTVKNIIRFNLFEADAGNGYYTVSGFKHKGMQRLTGYDYVDTKNAADSTPNDARYEAYGDQIYNNIFLGHEVGIEIDQDYTQIHNNIIVGQAWNRAFSQSNLIQMRDQNANRRGPYKPCVYNNTLISNGQRGIMHHPVPQGWSGTSPITATSWIQNNIIDGAKTEWHAGKLTVSSDGVTASTGYSLTDIHLDNNYFYRTSADSLLFVHTTYYNATEAQAAFTKNIFYQKYDASNLLYNGYKTIGTHRVNSSVTIANGGVGGQHPYLQGVTIPSYIGATDPNNNSWVDNVLNLKKLGADTNSSSGSLDLTDKVRMYAYSIDSTKVSISLRSSLAESVTLSNIAIAYRSDRFPVSPTETGSGLIYVNKLASDTVVTISGLTNVQYLALYVADESGTWSSSAIAKTMLYTNSSVPTGNISWNDSIFMPLITGESTVYTMGSIDNKTLITSGFSIDTGITVEQGKMVHFTVPVSSVNSLSGIHTYIICSSNSSIDTIYYTKPVKRVSNPDDFATEANVWHPVSVTAYPTNSTLASHILYNGSSSWSYDTLRERIINWAPTSLANNQNIYYEYGKIDNSHFTLIPGRLMWIKSVSQANLSFGEAVVPARIGDFAISLNKSGWTDFALPFADTVSLKEIIDATSKNSSGASIDSLELYRWVRSGNSYTSEVIYLPGITSQSTDSIYLIGGVGTGYTVFSSYTSAKSILIPAKKVLKGNSAVLAKKSVASTADQATGWGVRFKARQISTGIIIPSLNYVYAPDYDQRYFQVSPTFGNMRMYVYDKSTLKSFGHVLTGESGVNGGTFTVALTNNAETSVQTMFSVEKLIGLNNNAANVTFTLENGEIHSLTDSVALTLAAKKTAYITVTVGTGTVQNIVTRELTPGLSRVVRNIGNRSLQIELVSSGNSNRANVALFTISGKRIASTNFELAKVASKQQITLPLGVSALASGTYYVCLEFIGGMDDKKKFRQPLLMMK